MNLNPSTAQPLYMQIRQMLKNDIQEGKYKPDEQIPTEAELCDIYQVSRITIRKAIEELVKDGTLTRIQRKGTFVTSSKFQNELLSVSGFSEFSHQLGMIPNSRTLRSEVIPATADMAERLQIEEGSPVLELERLMYVNERPLFYDLAHYPLTRFPDLEKKIARDESTYKILKQDYETEIDSNDKIINVIGATKDLAKALECDVGANLFRIVKIAYDSHDRPVHLSTFMCETNKVNLTVHRAK
ncbi:MULTISPECIES: GntR family transcriptional regulator [Paenibacillus]|uniref:GntR family transcriptional regulator n=1 Tax=Paenibacillus TaxID=44249 RepID=UPI000FDB4873|nr:MULTISPECIES: GntR family transcriptional regulator [Paenibacillus]MBU7319133.1 transcriptional regulator PhoB [Paenibacillus oleatilyticus]MCP1310131.1 GntR family transcriptional regulator [Paenibacillus tyrfis]NEN87265.1 transcriptional regulator PhoB [Paenibacillus elgii]GMX63003.1 transcriptional regulator FrlR [Paenibacillus elgii]